jgi:hypothetical protein
MNNMDDLEGTPLDWNKHEEEILDVFVTQDKPLKEVMEHMKSKYGFIATYAFPESLPMGPTTLTSWHSARQYKYRFNRLKKVTDEEYIEIDQECQRRAALGKLTVVCLLGRLLAPERVRRGISRAVKNNPQSGRIAKRTSKCELIPSEGGNYWSAHKPKVKYKGQDTGRISFRTPSPALVGGQRLAPAPITTLATLQIPGPRFAPVPSQEDWDPPITSAFENDLSEEPMTLRGLPAGTLDIQPNPGLIGPHDVDMDITVDAEFGIGKPFEILRGRQV